MQKNSPEPVCAQMVQIFMSGQGCKYLDNIVLDFYHNILELNVLLGFSLSISMKALGIAERCIQLAALLVLG